jgi:hypothetical protein
MNIERFININIMTQQPTQPSRQPQVQPTQPVQKSGMSSGLKIFLGFCGGCLVLVLIALAIMYFTGRSIFKNVIEPEIEAQRAQEQNENLILSDGTGSTLADESGELIAAELPSDFPEDVPLFPDATLTYSAGESTFSGSTTLFFETSKGVRDIEQFYRTESENNGWNVVASYSDPDDEGVILTYQKEDAQAGTRTMIISVSRDTNSPVSVIGLTHTVGE